MAKRLFIGNIPYDMTEDQLKQWLETVGTVESVSIVINRMTGRSKGFAFADMDDKGAEEAIAKLNNTESNGRKIFVSEARPREERPYSRDGRGDSRDNDRRRDSDRRPRSHRD